VCSFFNEAKCTRGDECSYIHDLQSQERTLSKKKKKRKRDDEKQGERLKPPTSTNPVSPTVASVPRKTDKPKTRNLRPQRKGRLSACNI
jgi:hypothetical protein